MQRRRTIDTEDVLHNLFCQYGPSICRYLAQLTGDAERAQDLAQETFIRAYQTLEQGVEWENPRAWLYRVASRLAINEYRRKKLFQWLPLWDTEVDPAPGTEATLAEQLAVRKALARLPLIYRIPLLLYTTEGYSVSEIAATLQISPSAVKVRLYRARDKFRRAYGQDTAAGDLDPTFDARQAVQKNLPEENR